ncbi:hypothetical protein [Hyphomonas jannaschiana]|uniref:Uncharacterized protein n=1 Tax=Hyphomonas jannaschiana VP2 TaxID=1280952 RepID=A0A059FKH1_9PROT|nr:hypothetical protein [Hyphomonas jannaschiana]KCZ91139.1 hypothetical protein HJA_01335 [Hyphomonas jannaschiana VP2]
MGFLVSVLLSALGGIVAGLGAARLSRGNMTGGLLGGMIGAMSVFLYLHPVSEGGSPARLIALLEGAAGGALLGLAGGFMMRKKT